MLTKCKDVGRLDLDKGVNKPFENVSCQRRIQNFFTGEHQILTLFKRIFCGRVDLMQIEEQKWLLRGS